MNAGPDAIDQSWGVANARVLQRRHISLVMMYLSHTPSKNVTPAKIKMYFRHGVGVVFGWEDSPDACLRGARRGRKDARAAVAQLREHIRQVGHRPKNRITIYFACDIDTTPRDYPQIAAYFQAAGAACHAAGFGVGVYAEAAVLDHLARRGITDSEWGTYAWSHNKVSKYADLQQYLNGQHLGGAEVDFDRIMHADSIGAFWPAGSVHDRPPAHPIHVASTQVPSTHHAATGPQLPAIPPAAVIHANGASPKHQPPILEVINAMSHPTAHPTPWYKDRAEFEARIAAAVWAHHIQPSSAERNARPAPAAAFLASNHERLARVIAFVARRPIGAHP